MYLRTGTGAAVVVSTGLFYGTLAVAAAALVTGGVVVLLASWRRRRRDAMAVR